MMKLISRKAIYELDYSGEEGCSIDPISSNHHYGCLENFRKAIEIVCFETDQLHPITYRTINVGNQYTQWKSLDNSGTYLTYGITDQDGPLQTPMGIVMDVETGVKMKEICHIRAGQFAGGYLWLFKKEKRKRNYTLEVREPSPDWKLIGTTKIKGSMNSVVNLHRPGMVGISIYDKRSSKSELFLVKLSSNPKGHHQLSIEKAEVLLNTSLHPTTFFSHYDGECIVLDQKTFKRIPFPYTRLAVEVFHQNLGDCGCFIDEVHFLVARMGGGLGLVHTRSGEMVGKFKLEDTPGEAIYSIAKIGENVVLNYLDTNSRIIAVNEFLPKLPYID